MPNRDGNADTHADSSHSHIDPDTCPDIHGGTNRDTATSTAGP